MPTLTLQPSGTGLSDVYLDSFFPTTNYGNANLHQFGKTSSGNRKRICYTWDMSALPDGAVVTDATLTVKLYAGAGAPATFTASAKLHQISNSNFTESATWNSSNGTLSWTTAGGDFTSTGYVPFNYGAADISITGETFVSMANKAIATNAEQLSVILVSDSDAGGVSLSSHEYSLYYSSDDSTSSNRPSLVLQYELINKWKGTAGDGNLGTASNWSAGSVPVAGQRVLFADGGDVITRGTITCDIVCFGRNFRGKFGESGNPRSITAGMVYSRMTGGELHTSGTITDFFISDSPRGAAKTSVAGTVSKLFVSRSRSEITTTATIAEIVVSTPLGSYAQLNAGTSADGSFVGVGSNDSRLQGSPSSTFVAHGSDVRIDTNDENNCGRTSAVRGSKIDFRGKGITTSSPGIVSTGGKFDASEMSRAAVDVSSDLQALYDGDIILANGIGSTTFTSSALSFYGGFIKVDAGSTITVAGH